MGDAPRQRTLFEHTGAAFERGEVHERRGRNEAMPGVEPEDGREDNDGWTGGHANFAQTDSSSIHER